MKSSVLTLLALFTSLMHASCTSSDMDEASSRGPDSGPVSVDATTEVCAQSSTLVFLNGGGGTYSPGPNNASNNTSALLRVQASLAAYNEGAQQWLDLVACIEESTARYNFEFVDVDPGQAAHLEIAISGSPPTEVGLSASIKATAPSGNCQAASSSIAFVFTPTTGSQVTVQCETATRQLGLLLGMENTTRCEDLMSTSTSCEDKRFLNEEVACGILQDQSCECSTDKQNSHERLLEEVGAACQ